MIMAAAPIFVCQPEMATRVIARPVSSFAMTARVAAPFLGRTCCSQVVAAYAGSPWIHPITQMSIFLYLIYITPLLSITTSEKIKFIIQMFI
jgi:hypothetical protein